MELWRPIQSHPDYEISSFGRVRVTERERVQDSRWGSEIVRRLKAQMLNQSFNPHTGYWKMTLSRNRKHHTKYIHRLVAEAFLGPPQSGQQVAHNDGNVHNNAVWNLRWATQIENEEDKYEHGTRCRKAA